MSFTRSCAGVALLGAACAFPRDLLGEGTSLSAADAAAELLGDGWEAELERQGFDLERHGRGLGVLRRGWLRGRGLGSQELAVAAGRSALEHAHCVPAEIDAVFVATCTPPHVTKNLAAAVVNDLGGQAAAVDVRAGGAGGLEAWIAGTEAVRSGASRVLVIAAEAASPYANPRDLANALLFGDGAGALVLGKVEGPQGLLLAQSGTARVAGTPFTVPGRLPPPLQRPHARDDGAFRFQRPDAEYRDGLAATWAHVSEGLLQALEQRDLCADALLPYAVSRPQLDALGSAWGLEPDAARAQLSEHGCLGSAGALALVAKYVRTRGQNAPAQVLTSLAVGGGVSWCRLAWLG